MCNFIKYVLSKKLRVRKLKKKNNFILSQICCYFSLSLDDLSSRSCNISTHFQILINNLTFSYAKVQSSLISSFTASYGLGLAEAQNPTGGTDSLLFPHLILSCFLPYSLSWIYRVERVQGCRKECVLPVTII